MENKKELEEIAAEPSTSSPEQSSENKNNGNKQQEHYYVNYAGRGGRGMTYYSSSGDSYNPRNCSVRFSGRGGRGRHIVPSR